MRTTPMRTINITRDKEKSKGEFQNLQELRQRFLEARQALKDPEKRKEWELKQWGRWLDARIKPEEEKKREVFVFTQSTGQTAGQTEIYYAERLVDALVGRKRNRTFLNLSTKRQIHVNPARLSEPARRKIFYESKKKTKAPAYAFLVVSDGKPVDAGLVRTYPTLRKIDSKLKAEDKRILLHPQAISIPQGFWQKWKTARTPEERLRLIKQHELLTDKAVRTIDKIVLDVDTLYEKAFPKLLKIFHMLGIRQGYEVGRTKSGNLRAVIYLSFDINAQKEFRQKQHIERLREAYYILVEIFKRHELKLDRTFADRINHPVWFSFDNRFYRRESRAEGAVDFFTLYRAIKKWQEENEVWEVEGINLTQRFWNKTAGKGKKKIKVELPAFIRNELRTTFDEDYKLSLWKKAVKSLYRGKGGRFLNFIMPAIGWAKYLGLDRHEVDRYLEDFLSDRDPKKNQKDLNTAWKKARELEFTLPEGKGQSTHDLVEITEKALTYIRERKQVERQELIREVFYNQRWLCDKVMDFLEKKGLVRSQKGHKDGAGRPPKVYVLVETLLDEKRNLDNIITLPKGEHFLVEGGTQNLRLFQRENICIGIPYETVTLGKTTGSSKAGSPEDTLGSPKRAGSPEGFGSYQDSHSPLNGSPKKSLGSPQDSLARARELMAGLCERVRSFGIAVYEVRYQDRLAVYWERGDASIKVYEVRYKQKDLTEIEQELRHILGLVMRADRLIADGWREDLLFHLLLRARDNQGYSFVDKDDRLEVYMEGQLVKTYEREGMR